MISGMVAETIVVGDEVWLCVFDPTAICDSTGVWVTRTLMSLCISPGDTVRWQDHNLYWNPAGSESKDIRLSRIRGRPEERPEEITVEALSRRMGG